LSVHTISYYWLVVERQEQKLNFQSLMTASSQGPQILSLCGCSANNIAGQTSDIETLVRKNKSAVF